MNGLLFAQQPAAGTDWIDLLLQAGIVLTFIVFGVALLLVKLSKGKKSIVDPRANRPADEFTNGR